VVHFSSWLRKSYPDLFGTGKRSAPRKKKHALRLVRLEDRITPSFAVNVEYPGLNEGVSGAGAQPVTQGAAGTCGPYVMLAALRRLTGRGIRLLENER
jgi:hypothetical protein